MAIDLGPDKTWFDAKRLCTRYGGKLALYKSGIGGITGGLGESLTNFWIAGESIDNEALIVTITGKLFVFVKNLKLSVYK